MFSACPSTPVGRKQIPETQSSETFLLHQWSHPWSSVQSGSWSTAWYFIFFLLISACFCVSLQHQLQRIVAIRQQHGLIWVTHYDCAHTTTNTILYQFSMKLLSACHNTQNILLNQTWTKTKAEIYFKLNFYYTSLTDCTFARHTAHLYKTLSLLASFTWS